MEYVLHKVARGYDAYFDSYTRTHITVSVMSIERAKRFTKREAMEKAAYLNIGRKKQCHWKVIPYKVKSEAP